ncbi:MAG: DUF6345 domain-containing protein [Povalibacter sp.]
MGRDLQSALKRSACIVLVLAAPAALAEQLPVFQLSAAEVTAGRGEEVLNSVHGGRPPTKIETRDTPTALVQIIGNKQLEIEKASGGMFMRDSKQLWNAALKPRLPSQDKARQIADEFLKSARLSPADRYVATQFAGFAETAVSPDSGNTLDKTSLDVQVNYSVQVTVTRETGKQEALPIVGGGGDFKVALGNAGEIIGYTGVWRPIRGIVANADVIAQKDAEDQYLKSLGAMKVTKLSSSLAYYSAPSFERQSVLAPVWVMRGEADVDGNLVPLRLAIVAATKYGPEWRVPQLVPREDGQKPTDGSLDGDERFGANRSLLNFFISPAQAANPFEAGTSWIGPSQGLGGSPANAQGFVNNLANAGWLINFNWGEWTAFESDWNSNDDSWVDAADFVFYTGHANSDGWVLNVPNDTFLSYSEVGSWPGSPNDHWGQNDLEWLIVAACGPLQSSHFTTNVGNAFDRWRGAFDGLHTLMGYGAVTYDNTTEGSRVTQLALSGWTIIDAWFRAAWEIQPSTNGSSPPNGTTIFVTAMYASNASNDTRNDRIWGTGNTVGDSRDPNQVRWLMWSGT